MRKMLIPLLVILLLVAGCSNDPKETVTKDITDEANDEEEKIETLFEKEININIGDNDDLKVDLLHVRHGRADSTDYVSLKVKIENKQNKTFEFFIEDLKVDGKDIDDIHSWIGEGEIAPNDTIDVFINGYEYEELSINEHVAGKILYRDYDSNRNELEFSEYIND